MNKIAILRLAASLAFVGFTAPPDFRGRENSVLAFMRRGAQQVSQDKNIPES